MSTCLPTNTLALCGILGVSKRGVSFGVEILGVAPTLSVDMRIVAGTSSSAQSLERDIWNVSGLLALERGDVEEIVRTGDVFRVSKRVPHVRRPRICTAGLVGIQAMEYRNERRGQC